jgi:hypothetical protein
MAKSKMLSIEKLEARYHALKMQIDKLEVEKKDVSIDLINLLIGEEMKETPGIEGYAYRLIAKLETDYDRDTQDYVIRNELAPLFTPPMKITYAKVMDLNKKNKLTLAQFTRIQKGALDIQPRYSLTQFKQKEETEEAV